ncbi:MAG: adenylate/guanylate cyclase domain-containing protein [Actinomycetota bacterium]
MKCPSCQQENREGAAFCDRCGAVLSPRCPQCEAQLRPGARFCDTCGVSVAEAAAQASPEAKPVETDPRAFTPTHLVQKIMKERGRIAGERRNVTVLFADAKGFTPLSESLDAEQVYTFIQGGYEHMLDAVHRYEGTVNQFTGDGIMALFGAPIAHEDSARRAVAAGLDMQRALTKYTEDAGVSVAFRVGINTGPVVVGGIGDDLTMDYTAIGDTTNLAARMEQMAEPGGVYLTSMTHHEAADYFDFDDLGPVDVKGKAEKVHVYKALEERDVRTRMDAAVARGLSPFCGRNPELETLKGLWQQALAGRGQIVLISGEPGIGKSRLLLEFHRALGEDVIWREAHCVSYGENIPYLPVVELVKTGFGIADGDDEGTIIGKVDADTVHWSPEAQKTASYLKFLLQVDPGDAAVEHMDPMERRAGILDALRALVLERSQVAPRVVVVEDLHWADAQSEEVIRAIADVVSASPVLMILTFRPGYLHPSADLPHAHRIILSDLDPEARIELAEATLGAAELPESLVGPVTKKAEGNPLFIEEVSKALAAGATDAEAVPNSLQDVILARIDRLEVAARQSLQLASVIGREFTLRLLDRISDLQTELAGVLSELKGLELIYEKSFFPELAYMFKHALTHDVAYSTLLVERRKTLHRVVAAAIEELYGDRLAENYETLAYHYEQAEDWSKALDYLEKAAEKATAAFANHEAYHFASRAIEIAQRLGDKASQRRIAALAELQGIAEFSVGDLALASDAFGRSAAAARAAGDRGAEAIGLASRAMVQMYEHELETADTTALAALEIAGDEINARTCGTFVRWAVALFTGRYDETAEYLKTVEESYPLLTHPWTRAMCGSLLPLAHEWAGRFDIALQTFGDARARTGDSIDTLTYLFGRWADALSHTSLGEHQKALDILHQEIPFAERVGVMLMYLRALNTLGWVYLDLNDYDNSLVWNRKGFDAAINASLPDPEIECNAALNIGDSLRALGRLDEAEEQYRWVEGIYRDPTPAQRFMLWRYSQHMLHSYGELWLERGDPVRAAEYARECLDLAERSDSPKNAVKARRLIGQALMAQGKLDEAGTEIAAAVASARSTSNAGQLWRSAAALGDVRAAQGRSDEARVAYAEALELIDRIASGLTDTSVRDTFLGSHPVSRLREAVEA